MVLRFCRLSRIIYLTGKTQIYANYHYNFKSSKNKTIKIILLQSIQIRPSYQLKVLRKLKKFRNPQAVWLGGFFVVQFVCW